MVKKARRNKNQKLQAVIPMRSKRTYLPMILTLAPELRLKVKLQIQVN